jgi:hypothetical protein
MDYKTGTLGRNEEDVKQKLKHEHRYNQVGRCHLCGREKQPFWGDKSKWTSGKETTPST